METIESVLERLSAQAVKELFGFEANEGSIQFQKTDRKFEGDITLVVFPFVKAAKKSPEETGRMIGEYLQAHCPDITAFNTVKGFLNLSVSDAYWVKHLDTLRQAGDSETQDSKPVVIE